MRFPWIQGMRAAALLAAGACSSGTTGPEIAAKLEFSVPRLQMGSAREASVRVLNTGEVALGPVALLTGTVRDAGGLGVPGSEVRVTPTELPTLHPGASADVRITVALPATTQPGDYDASVSATVPDGVRADLDVRFSVEAAAVPTEGGEIAITASATAVRQGDVQAFAAEVRNADGDVVPGVPVTWRVIPASAGYVTGNGRFVGFVPGPARLAAAAGGLRDTLDLTVNARDLRGELTLVGRGVESERYTSDLWAFGGYVYTGTWGARQGRVGNRLQTWRIADPTAPVRVSSLQVDARTVNDVKVRADGRLAVITHEASNDGLNGVTLVDLSDPAEPRAIHRFTQGLESGVHNVWLEGRYAYLVVDGSAPAAGLHILDIGEPTAPRTVARFYGGESFLHDVYVRDGLAFLSHWNAGLIILDVGNGVAGGSPTRPVEVSRIKTAGGQTHNAWYWPAAGYVFVGEEDFGAPGMMHVVDVRNLAEPREVATFALPLETPHNFWLDESRAVLYMAWYQNGVRALDVSGELMGELDRQGREYDGLQYDGAVGACPGFQATCSWAPQLHLGLVYVADVNGGLRVLQPGF